MAHEEKAPSCDLLMQLTLFAYKTSLASGLIFHIIYIIKFQMILIHQTEELVVHK